VNWNELAQIYVYEDFQGVAAQRRQTYKNSIIFWDMTPLSPYKFIDIQE
jgi:hypothetical protein